MKIITWNCNMAFRKKAEVILRYKPDILIVPECEHPEKLKFKEDTAKLEDCLWFGQNQNKGLGIFSYSPFRFKVNEVHNQDLQIIIPISVTAGNLDFTLFAIWANNPHDSEGRYIEQVWKAIKHYDRLLSNKRTILIGDFNSNSIWDRANREANHSALVEQLEKRGIYSVYHHHFNQAQGKEEHPTLYMYRHKDKAYHIDYCFASQDLVDQLQSVEIGEFDPWMKYSDHTPVVITFNNSWNM